MRDRSTPRPMNLFHCSSIRLLGAFLAATSLRAVESSPAAPGVDPAAVHAVLAEFEALLRATPDPKIQPEPVADPGAARLRGIVVLADPAAVAPVSPTLAQLTGQSNPRPGQQLIDLRAVPVWNERGLAEALRPLLGAAITPELPPRLVTAVQEFARAHDRPFVAVTVPPQDATSGVVQLVLQDAVIGQVSVRGAQWFAEDYYLSRLGVRSGDTPTAQLGEPGLADLNRRPFHQARLEAAPGAAAGTTDLVLAVNETRPWRITAGYNDSGTRTTDRSRVVASLQWGHAFARGDTLGYNFAASPDFERSVSHALSYTAYLPRAATLSLSANVAKIRPDLAPPFNQTGRSGGATLGYSRPLGTAAGWQLEGFASLDFKQSDNNLLFGGIPVTDNLTRIVQAVLRFDASRGDARGHTRLGAGLTLSPGGLGGANDDAAFGGMRAGAKARYAVLGLDATRTTKLPGDWSWVLDARVQFATGPLLGSEQLGLGGSASVRGYEEGEVYGDQGFLVKSELRAPPLGVAAKLGLGDAGRDQLQPLVFIEGGWAGNRGRLPGEERGAGLLSAGLGLRYSLGQTLSLRADYGWQIEETGRNRFGNHRGHLSVTAAW